MKKILLALSITGISFFSCNKEIKPLSKEEIEQRIDSITTSRNKEIDDRAKVDLEHRIKIEVRVKVDSILNATMPPKAKDTMAKK